MIDNLQQFVTTYSRLFPGEPVPPMPQKPEDLSMTVMLAMRDANPVLWQNMFGGHGAPLPADVQQRLLTGQVNPEDAGALRAAHMDAYAADADRQREAVIERSREATRAREKAIYEAQAKKRLNSVLWDCLVVWLLHPLVSVQPLRHVLSGALMND